MVTRGSTAHYHCQAMTGARYSQPRCRRLPNAIAIADTDAVAS